MFSLFFAQADAAAAAAGTYCCLVVHAALIRQALFRHVLEHVYGVAAIAAVPVALERCAVEQRLPAQHHVRGDVTSLHLLALQPVLDHAERAVRLCSMGANKQRDRETAVTNQQHAVRLQQATNHMTELSTLVGESTSLATGCFFLNLC